MIRFVLYDKAIKATQEKIQKHLDSLLLKFLLSVYFFSCFKEHIRVSESNTYPVSC